MSKVTFLDPIDHVSGKLSKKSRVTYCYRHPGLSEKGEDRKYTQIRSKRSTPYTAAELARFDKFSAVAKAVAAVMKNPAALQTAQAVQETPQLLVGPRMGKLPRLIAFGCVVRQGAFIA